MSRRRPDAAALDAASRTAARISSGDTVARPDLAAAVRVTLAELAHRNPGRLVEVRVPPFAAVQIGAPGASSVHTRGTPPNVVETDPATWLALASGRLGWDDARAAHQVSASGTHASLHGMLPVF
ncbi:MAG: sterol carrier family protein [Propioniciclava sp.]|uniref:sterol carrier family protein n=1 Tax=Propioniciclava sp. TaxID=2038686 RepID=UPI0039E6DB2C